MRRTLSSYRSIERNTLLYPTYTYYGLTQSPNKWNGHRDTISIFEGLWLKVGNYYKLAVYLLMTV